MKRTLLLVFGLMFLFAVEIMRVYFIMPFPGSQKSNTIAIAYFINKYVWWLRLVGLLMLIPLVWYAFGHTRLWKKITLAFFLFLFGAVFYLVNFRFLADKMFYQPKNKVLATVSDNKVDSSKLVIGITINGQSKAYPIEIIGYHHQVADTVGGQPVMVTYCTVCRTGRVFSPFVKGEIQHFRLVGMDHFNAMFEDADTKSWWRQATGIAVAGPLKGAALKELPSQQLGLGAWIKQYPNTLILQPDSLYAKQYKDLEGFDNGTIKSSLEKRDSGSWQFKSWVVGVQLDNSTKAYDWNDLMKQKIINDTIGNSPIVLVLESDHVSFHVWNSRLNEKQLQFSFNESAQTLQDAATNSVWDLTGNCIAGALKGNRISPVPAYQEFWHSWQYFHPATTKYGYQ